MAAPDIRIDLVSEFKDKGFKQANKSSIALEKQFKRLGRTFAGVLSVAAITRFSKQAVKAFEEDETAARRLTQTLTNLGMAFEDPYVTTFVSDLEKATGVLDDQLRPAMGKLLTTTASFIKSQELMTLAIDISRGSSIGLETVVSDLSRAYVGQTRGLTKYGLGLTTVELQTKSFAELQILLNKQFGGQSQAFLETYSGKISLLNVAYANMSETIGESLVDAMMLAAGDNGIAGLTNAMEDFGRETADVIRGVGVLLSFLGRIPGVKTGGIAAAVTSPFGVGLKVLSELGKREAAQTLQFPIMGIGQPALDKQRAAFEKARIAREKELEKLRKKAAAEEAKREADRKKREREQQALKRAGTVFDMEAIQITAALQGKVTEEQRLRLTALLAIQQKNVEAAEKLSTAVLFGNAAALSLVGVTVKAGDDVDKVITKLINAQTKVALTAAGIADIPKAKNPFEDWPDILAKIIANLSTINTLAAGRTPAAGEQTGENVFNPLRPMIPYAPPAQIASTIPVAAEPGPTVSLAGSVNQPAQITVNVNVEGTVTSADDLGTTIRNLLYQSQTIGNPITVSRIAI